MGIKYGTKKEDKLTPNQIRLMNGVLLGTGHINKQYNRIELKTKYNRIELKTNDEEYAEWLAEEFSNIDGRVVNRGEKVEFRTGRYSWVEKWRKRWYYRNLKIVPPNMKLTPEMAGLWYYARGSVHPRYGRLSLNMRRID